MVRLRRFAARRSGLASGLALAVRPGGLAETPACKGPKMLFAERVVRSGQDLRVPLRVEGLDPDNTRRSGPTQCPHPAVGAPGRR